MFELLAMKRLAVVNRVPDLELFFEPGRDLLVFDTHEQAVSQVMSILDEPEKLEEIAAQGNKTVQPHSWDTRVETILNEII